MATFSSLILMPSYNTGPRLLAVVREALEQGWPVRVIIDGSDDGSDLDLPSLQESHPQLSLLHLPTNQGKGAAVLAGARSALAEGFTHGLVMDADGQHPAASIPEFMEAARHRPDAQVLGRPRFPSNIPVERLHARKLSVGLVWLELLGGGIADPLFGFRVYPLEPLMATLGPRRGGRRYDFDTESAVRLAWAGVPPINLSAPVRYFSRAEGGVSHFHYLRDNLCQVWLHARLLTELILRRWPTMRRHRHTWRAAGWIGLMIVGLLFSAGSPAFGAGAPEAAPPSVVVKDELINAGDWGDLARAFAQQPDTVATFTENRFFPFKKIPVVLTGVARVSAKHGLSLHYQTPSERTVILDSAGMLIRTASGDVSPPSDPRADAANRALRHVLRFDFAALENDFELHGRRDGSEWSLVLVPRVEDLRRTLGRITVKGTDTQVRRIELRRSALQAVEIEIDLPSGRADFSAEDRRRYFR